VYSSVFQIEWFKSVSFPMSKFIPKNPDTYFPVIGALRAHALEVQESLLAEADKVQIDTFAFFDGIRSDEVHLTESQRALHEEVLDIEKRWATAETVNASHQPYREAVHFFNRKEQTIREMTAKMEELTNRVPELPH
jgi:alpha/beta superfamily hydrolase